MGRTGAMVGAARDGEGFPRPQSKQREGPGAPERRIWEETSSQFPGGKQQNTKIKINILNDCSTADLLPKGSVSAAPLRSQQKRTSRNDWAPLRSVVGSCRI